MAETKKPPITADSLLQKLRGVRKNIFDEELRVLFLAELKEFSERRVAELNGRPDDPPMAICQMLLIAAKGTRHDEFTTPKLDALDRALVVAGVARISVSEVERCRQEMLAAGLLGFGYSGGNRRTVDGKY